MTPDMIKELISKISEMFADKLEHEIQSESNGQVRSGLEKAKNIILDIGRGSIK